MTPLLPPTIFPKIGLRSYPQFLENGLTAPLSTLQKYSKQLKPSPSLKQKIDCFDVFPNKYFCSKSFTRITVKDINIS